MCTIFLQMKKFERILQKIWLSEKESQIYLDLLDHPYSSMLDISRRTGIHRPALYKLLPLLRERGLVFIKTKKKQISYHASSPTVLQDLLDEMSGRLESVLPELQSVYDAHGHHVHTAYHDGIAGIQKIYEEIARLVPEDDAYYAYTGKKSKAGPEYFTPTFWKMRDKKRLKRYVIGSKDRTLSLRTDPLREVATFPERYTSTIFEKNMVKIIYHHRVAIIDFSLNTWVVIESPILAQMEKDNFLLLFHFLKKSEI